jgi:hypothetical protein
MLMLIPLSFVIGALLATKFRVLVLLPMTILGGAAILFVSVLHPIAAICAEIIGYTISLQFGYLFAAGTQHLLIGGRPTYSRRGMSAGTTSAPPAH